MVVYGARHLARRQQAYDLLAQAVRERWGLSPMPQILREAGGKPYFSGDSGCQFNLSHSGDLALCVLDSAPVGIDIQVIRAWRPALVRRVCSPSELAWLEDGDAFWSRFTQLWALKECRVKHSGAGLRQPVSQISVPLPQEDGEAYQMDGLWFRTYSGEGWRGAVCGLTPPPRQIRWLDCGSPYR